MRYRLFCNLALIIIMAMVFFLVAPLSMSTMANAHVLGVMAISELIFIATLFFIGTDNCIKEKMKSIIFHNTSPLHLVDRNTLRIFDLNRLAALTEFAYPLLVLWNQTNLTAKILLITGCGVVLYIWREGYRLLKS